jgi:hypothetical protein
VNNQVYDQLAAGEIGVRKAYSELYKTPKARRYPRAHFLKLRIRTPEEKGVNRFLAFLFWLPIPLLYVRIGLAFVKAKDGNDPLPLPKQEIMKLLSYRGIVVEVDSKDGTKILIKTL